MIEIQLGLFSPIHEWRGTLSQAELYAESMFPSYSYIAIYKNGDLVDEYM